MPSPAPSPVHVTTPAPDAGLRPSASSDAICVIVEFACAVQPPAPVANAPFVTRLGAAVALPDAMSSPATMAIVTSTAISPVAAVPSPIRRVCCINNSSQCGSCDAYRRSHRIRPGASSRATVRVPRLYARHLHNALSDPGIAQAQKEHALSQRLCSPKPARDGRPDAPCSASRSIHEYVCRCVPAPSAMRGALRMAVAGTQNTPPPHILSTPSHILSTACTRAGRAFRHVPAGDGSIRPGRAS